MHKKKLTGFIIALFLHVNSGLLSGQNIEQPIPPEQNVTVPAPAQPTASLPQPQTGAPRKPAYAMRLGAIIGSSVSTSLTANARRGSRNLLEEQRRKFDEYQNLIALWKKGLTKTTEEFEFWVNELRNNEKLQPYIEFIERMRLQRNWAMLEAWSTTRFWDQAQYPDLWNPTVNHQFMAMWVDENLVQMWTDPSIHFLCLAIASKAFLLRKPKPQVNFHEISAGMGGYWAKGNLNKTNFTYNFLYERYINFWQIRIFAKGSFYKDGTNPSDSIHEGNFILGYNLFAPILTIFYSGEVGADSTRSVEIFTNQGAGAKLTLFGDANLKWFQLEATYFPILLEYTVPNKNTLQSTTKMRTSLGFGIKFFFDEEKRSSISLSGTIAPYWKTFKDYYFFFRAAIESTLSDSDKLRFSLALTFDYKYYSVLLDPIKKNSDYRLNAAFNIYFKHGTK